MTLLAPEGSGVRGLPAEGPSPRQGGPTLSPTAPLVALLKKQCLPSGFCDLFCSQAEGIGLPVRLHFLCYCQYVSFFLSSIPAFCFLSPLPQVFRGGQCGHATDKGRENAVWPLCSQGQRGPVLPPGLLWPLPGVRGSRDFRDRHKVKTIVPQNRSGKIILVSGDISQARTSLQGPFCSTDGSLV